MSCLTYYISNYYVCMFAESEEPNYDNKRMGGAGKVFTSKTKAVWNFLRINSFIFGAMWGLLEIVTLFIHFMFFPLRSWHHLHHFVFNN